MNADRAAAELNTVYDEIKMLSGDGKWVGIELELIPGYRCCEAVVGGIELGRVYPKE